MHGCMICAIQPLDKAVEFGLEDTYLKAWLMFNA